MGKRIFFWSLAFIITAGSAIYQRKTGPSYPVDGSVEMAGTTATYDFARSHSGDGDHEVIVIAPDEALAGELHFRKYRHEEEFTSLVMIRRGDSLMGYLPHQPPAGKLEYYVSLIRDDSKMSLPVQRTVVIRFTGAVPISILLSHAVLMFVAMFLAARTGLEAISRKGKTRNLTIATVVAILIGGMILGPVVQKLAFGELWTGVPFGFDLTDNKTLIAFIFWVVALLRHKYNPQPRYWVLAAAIVLFVIFMIPHSMLGSELDYTTGEVVSG